MKRQLGKKSARKPWMLAREKLKDEIRKAGHTILTTNEKQIIRVLYPSKAPYAREKLSSECSFQLWRRRGKIDFFSTISQSIPIDKDNLEVLRVIDDAIGILGDKCVPIIVRDVNLPLSISMSGNEELIKALRSFGYPERVLNAYTHVNDIDNESAVRIGEFGIVQMWAKEGNNSTPPFVHISTHGFSASELSVAMRRVDAATDAILDARRELPVTAFPHYLFRTPMPRVQPSTS
jgi:hypothetical protein